MLDIRQHIVFLAVVVATGAIMALAGPASFLTVSVVFLGLFLVHLNGLRVADRDGGVAVAARTPSGGRERAAPTKRSATREVLADTRVPDPEPARRSATSSSSGAAADLSAAPSRGGTSGEPRGPERPAAGASLRAAAGTDEEFRWLNEQLAGDVDDVTFLPPYASGADVEEGSAADDESDAGWTPPESVRMAADAQEREEAPQAVDTSRDVPIPRHFALGTVAIIRDLMQPGEVAQILLEQRRQPREKFGELAVRMGFLTPEQLGELLQAQQEGLFTDEEIREARRRLRSFRQAEAGRPA